MRKKFLVFGNPLIEQPEIDEVVDSLKSGWIGTGPKVKKFEEDFKKYQGVEYAMALNSCTAAMHLGNTPDQLGHNILSHPLRRGYSFPLGFRPHFALIHSPN
jgi:dTDP-4-amino-4,6-dideoxygalactose transaminase